MAITFNDILANIEEAKNRLNEFITQIQDTQSEEFSLSGLDSESTKAEYSLWQNVFAAMSYIVDQSVNERISELDEFSDQRHGFSAAWLDKILRDYQEGDTLEIHPDSGLPYYAVIDTEKQIIKRVAIIQGNGSYTAKVAGEDGNGDAVPFDSGQLAAIKSYLDSYILGNHGAPESKPSDFLKAEYDIYFNALKGEDTVRPLVESAINDYLGTLKTIDFGGTFYLSRIEDAIQSVEDVVDFERKVIEARTNTGAFETVARLYVPDAGYMDIDPAYPLSSTLNFIPV